MNENIKININKTPSLFLCRGVPGSGKSTIAHSLKVDVIFEADQYFVNEAGEYVFDRSKLSKAHEWCEIETRKAMQHFKDIAVANTFTTMFELAPYLELADQYGYTVHSLIVEHRHNSKTIHNVPTETLRRMASRFEVQLTRDNYHEFVKVKKYDNGLEIHKFNRKVFFGNLWNENPKLVDARGTVYDSEGKLVQYPFTKIFNYKENGTVIEPTHRVLAVDKINGFMGSVTWYNNEPLLSTTGSLDSDFVGYIRDLMPLDRMREGLQYYSNYSFCFEVVHPDDPHIIEEEIGVYLIGGRFKDLGSKQMDQQLLDELAQEWGVKRPTYFKDTFAEVLEKVRNYKREGFVVYDLESTQVLKLKSPYYLTAKFIARTKKVNLLFKRDYKQRFDEEFYPLCEWLQGGFDEEEFAALPEQTRLNIIRKFFNEIN